MSRFDFSNYKLDEADGVFGTKTKDGDKTLPDEDTPGLGDAAEDHVDTSVYMR